MKKIVVLLIALATSTALVACNNHNDHSANGTKKETQPVKATLIAPEEAKIGDKIELKITLTQNSKTITSAKDVAFEIKNNDTDTDQMITARLKNHSYVASYEVKNIGKYKITAHVSTKSGEHIMPNTAMTVADSSTNSEHAERKDHKATTEAATEEHEHHHDVTITYNHQRTATKDKEMTFNVSLKYDGKALSSANIRYQVLPQFDGGHPTWITLKEASKGTYEGKHTFTHAGKYQLKLHVENNEGLHAHEVKDFIVRE
ncbi:FixH family protein [Rummeliibacillus suwonensis]|uniref:FixH family protein n=1 Tax=Rummeliibacillus suwonensis TaxID=1306154 RepID=UPI001AAE93EB|nr:FixH family protein [Rummeliibacillus suwonensis]MBO2536836.1 FixH family protein [Rummeliibacillus suwonensis]